MKKFKNFICMFLLVLCTFSFTACDNNKNANNLIKLNTPTNINISNNIVSWSSVNNADSYIISMNNNETTTTLLEYPIYGLIQESGNILIKIKAKGNGITTLDSDWSEVKTYNYTKENSSTDNYDEDVYNKLNKYNLCSGINVITGNYLSFDSNTFPSGDFLDKTKIANSFKLKEWGNVKSSILDSISKNSLSDFNLEFSAKYTHTNNTNLGLNVTNGFGFTSTLSNKFTIDGGFNITTKTNQIYHLSYQTITDSRQSIQDFSKNTIKNGNFLSQTAIYSLNELNNLSDSQLETSINNFFTNFGTHIITDATYGGKIEIYYYMLSNSTDWDANIGIELHNSFKSSYSGESSNISNENLNSFDSKLKIGSNNETTIANFYAKSVGGIGFNVNTYSEFASAYKEWIDAYNSQTTEHNTMINIENQGLCPIWELLPPEYSDLSKKMLEVFNKLLKSTNNEFLSKFDTNTTNYIYDEKDLYNIKNNLSGNYILMNDIDISGFTNWEPIGGAYKENVFTGTFDGNNHSIIGLKRTSTVAPKNDRLYFGLFGYIGSGAVVKNLTFKDVNIIFDGPGNNGNFRLYYGVLAGRCDGVITNVTVESGTFTHNSDSAGTSYLGGLVGVSNNAKFNNCINKINISNSRGATVSGGIVAHSVETEFTECKNYGEIASKTYYLGGIAYAGGIVGEYYEGTPSIFLNCENNGKITATRVWNATTKTGDIFSSATDTKLD